jgi:hypothetical protein
VFLFGQTRDNQHSVFSAAHHLITENFAKNILIVKSGPKSGYPGYDHWKKELVALGISEDSISGIDLEVSPTLNTLIEATGMIEYARENRYKTMYVVAAPFHQTRAFMTSITVALRIYPPLRLYSYSGHPLSWSETVAHSQGKTIGSRKELIKGEIERISTYQSKGDLAADSDVLDYLDKRDMTL